MTFFVFFFSSSECSTDHSQINLAALITISVLFGVSIIIIIALTLKILSQKETINFVNENTSAEKTREEHESVSQGNVNGHVNRDLSSLDYGFLEDNGDDNEDSMVTSEL